MHWRFGCILGGALEAKKQLSIMVLFLSFSAVSGVGLATCMAGTSEVRPAG